METTIHQLAERAGTYTGLGHGSESGPFSATIEVRPLLDGLGVAIDYEALDPDGERLHIEQTTLTFDMMTGEPTLYVLCEELRGMGQLHEIAVGRFSNGAGHEGFELQIEIGLDDDELTYVWHWAPPHEELAERSRATVRRA